MYTFIVKLVSEKRTWCSWSWQRLCQIWVQSFWPLQYQWFIPDIHLLLRPKMMMVSLKYNVLHNLLVHIPSTIFYCIVLLAYSVSYLSCCMRVLVIDFYGVTITGPGIWTRPVFELWCRSFALSCKTVLHWIFNDPIHIPITARVMSIAVTLAVHRTLLAL